jgi:NTE family protein
MHGYAHVGVLREIEARKLPVSVVAGTSVGALVGALWASGLKAADIEALARSENLADLGRPSGNWWQGLMDNSTQRAPLELAFHGKPIERWALRFGAVATNVANGERRLITTGSGATAILASTAVPVLYQPIVVDGERLVDGALVEPVPVDAARDLGANLVIGVDVGYRPYEEETSGLTGYAFQAMHILVNSLAAAQLRSADVAIRLNLHHRFTECGREALIDAGRDAMRRAWPDVQRAIAAHANPNR